MAGGGNLAGAALENMPRVDEGVAVAKRDLLDQARAVGTLLKRKARHGTALRMFRRVLVLPARIGRPAVGRHARIVSAAERRAEEVAGKEAKIGWNRLVVCNRGVIDPGRRVERRQAPSVALDLEGPDVADRQVNDEA